MRRAAQSLALLATLSLPAAASAHGGEPLARAAVRTDDQGGWALVTNFGILTHDDLTHYICEEAFLGGDDFRVVALGPSRWLTFSRAAIMKTEDGCTFRQIAPLTRAPAAVASAGERVLYASNDEAIRGLFVSQDAGERFEAATPPGAEQVLWTGAGALADGAFVVSGYDSAPGEARGDARLWRIAPSGEATALALPEGAKYPYLMTTSGAYMAGIMGVGESQVAFWAQLGAGGVAAIAQHTLTRWPGGMALDEAGQTLWIAGASPSGGLWRGEWAAGQPTWSIAAPDHPARCVLLPADEPLLCASRMTQGHDVSALGADGSWAPRISFTDLLGPRRGCPAGSQVRQVCPAVWDELAVALRVDPDREPPEQDAPDMGAPIEDMMGEDSAPDQSAAEPGDRVEGGCTCAAPGEPGAISGLGALWAALWGFTRLLGRRGSSR